MTYPEAIAYLNGLTRFGVRLGLDNARQLAAEMGNPHHRLRFVHVAGTNGKGSTCAFLESIYRHAGLRVGLYTSPHLVSFRERIQVNRECIPEQAVAELTERIRRLLKDKSAEEQPTFFEFTTVMALQWFADQRCDLVIWETGLGGRLDATNIVDPEAAVITNVGWDHMTWLGSSLAAIAREKAGIIKPGVPVVAGASDPEALEVIANRAHEMKSPLRVLRPNDTEVDLCRDVGVSLAGEFQVLNAALAACVVAQLSREWPVNKADLGKALRHTEWAGRFDVRQRDRQTIVLDGAHNRPAFEALADALNRRFPNQTCALVLGMLADKDANAAAEILLPHAHRVVIVPVRSNRATGPDMLLEICRKAAPAMPLSEAVDAASALRVLANEALVLVTGSLYLVGEIMEVMSSCPISERELNDWGRKA